MTDGHKRIPFDYAQGAGSPMVERSRKELLKGSRFGYAQQTTNPELIFELAEGKKEEQ